MATRLSPQTLNELPPRIGRPKFARGDLSPGILHVGVGNFHRAHQAVYLNDLFNMGRDHDWALLGAGVMSFDDDMRTDLEGQDWLYTVLEQDAENDSAQIVGAMTGFLPVAGGHGPILQAMADPGIRIVSLTVTEGGYFLNSDTGSFDPSFPQIRKDIADPASPTTVFGAIVAGLRARRDAGAAPFTVMSCDNLPHNGNVTRDAVVGIAREQDPALADWIAAEVAFPNGMVDRITPATTAPRRAHLAEEFGIEDARPVFCEPFRQWVLEDRFTAGRPALEEVGVQFVPDVTPYEHMKLRILNGGHALIAYISGLLGIEFVHEAMAHPVVSAFLTKVERQEVIPVVPPVPDTSLEGYYELIRDRFGNPRIGDQIRRLCFDGSNRQPKFVVPSIRDNLARGNAVDGLALGSALWCRYCLGRDEAGREIAPNDPNWDRLTAQAAAAKDRPPAWLEMRDVYGDVSGSRDFGAAFEAALRSIYGDGVAATVKAYLDRG